MSIPDRFYRIARHKMGEIKDWFDKVDEEEESDVQQRRADPRADAHRELSDTMTPSGNSTSAAPRPGVPLSPPRTPQEITRGARPAPGSTYSPGAGTNNPTVGSSNLAAQPDPLDYHYKLLGLEPGADFAAVQAAYSRLAARSDPSRFPAGSSDAQAAQEIRQRLDVSFRTLRESLDSTAARFDRLEF